MYEYSRNPYWVPYGMYEFMRAIKTLDKQKERLEMNKNTLVLNVDGVTRTVNVTDGDLQAISEFVKEQIEDNGTCTVTDKITELFEITDYPIEREYVVTVVVRVTASDDYDAEEKVNNSMNSDLDYEIEGVDEV